MASLVKDADQQEEGAGAQAVVDHLQHGAADGLGGQGEDAEHDEAHVGHAGVGHQALDVLLGQRHQRAVDDADQRQDREQGRKCGHGLGEEG